MDQITAIRRAVSSGEFQTALRLWKEYSTALRSDFERGAITRARLAEALELLEWTRRAALASRAHSRDRLHAIRVSQSYSQSPSPHPRPHLLTEA